MILRCRLKTLIPLIFRAWQTLLRSLRLVILSFNPSHCEWWQLMSLSFATNNDVVCSVVVTLHTCLGKYAPLHSSICIVVVQMSINTHLWTQLYSTLCVCTQSSTPLLNSSAQKSKADLGKRRIRTRPSRSLRAGLSQRKSPDWRTHDSSG